MGCEGCGSGAAERAWVEVAAEGEIEPGSFRCVWVAGEPVDLFNVEGRYYAMGDICTHAETHLSEGDFYEDIRGWVIECPLHGSQFDVTTGDAVTLPATGNAGKYAVRVAEGKIYVCPDPEVPFHQ